MSDIDRMKTARSVLDDMAQVYQDSHDQIMLGGERTSDAQLSFATRQKNKAAYASLIVRDLDQRIQAMLLNEAGAA